MAWGSSITADRTKGTQDLLLVVTTARVALDFKSSGLEDGVGLGFWKGIGLFGLVIRARCHSCWQGQGSLELR
jgi:hypothetical protein